MIINQELDKSWTGRVGTVHGVSTRPPPHKKKSPAHSIKNILWVFSNRRKRPKGYTAKPVPRRSLSSFERITEYFLFRGSIFSCATPGRASSSLLGASMSGHYHHPD